MVTFTMGETVTRQRQKLTTNRYSKLQDVGGWNDPDVLEIVNVAIGPSSTFASEDPMRSSITTTMSVFADFAADLLPGDRIVTESGDVWLLEGEALHWRNPYNGSTPGLEVRITRVLG